MEKKPYSPKYRTVSAYSKEALESGLSQGCHETWDGEVDIPIPERIRVNIWIDSDLYFAVKRKLLDHKIATHERLTITDILTQALKDYIDNPKEGKEVKNKTYAVQANEGWENEHILYTVGDYHWYKGWFIVDGITEDELDLDDEVIEYREVRIIDPGKGCPRDYYPPEDKHGYAIRF